MITLPITLGEQKRQFIDMVNFIIAEAPMTYNAIFGQPLFNAFCAIVSTYHVAIKFPTKGKKITMRRNLN